MMRRRVGLVGRRNRISLSLKAGLVTGMNDRLTD